MGTSNAVSTVFISMVVFYSIAVLFGAHPVNQLWGNLLWAALITCLVCVPALAVLGTRAHQWVRVLIHSRFSRPIERGLYFGCLATLLGGWVGAFPILLDWNRPWQVWPIPCCIGAMGVWLCYWLCYATIHCYWPNLLKVDRTTV